MIREAVGVGAAVVFVSLSVTSSGEALEHRSAAPALTSTFLQGVTEIAPDDVWTVGAHQERAISTHWDGTDWSDVSVPVPQGGSTLKGVDAAAADDIWAVGYVIGPDPGVVAVIEHWDGSRWTQVPCPNPGKYGTYLAEVSVDSATDAWAIGYYVGRATKGVIEHWDGETWRLVDHRFRDRLTGVSAVTPDDVWVSGWGNGAGLLRHWDGASWERVDTVARGFYGGVSAASAREIMVVGEAGPRTVYDHIVHGGVFGGTTVNPGDLNNELFDVDAVAAHDFWAVGSFAGVGARGDRLLAVHFLDGQWTRSRPVGFKGHASKLLGVDGNSPEDVWVVGTHSMHNPDSYPLVEHYDGSSWKIVLQ